MSETGRLLKNTGYIALGNMGAKIASFLLLPLYTTILSTSDYGTYDFIVALGTLLLPVVLVEMNEALFRFLIDEGDDDAGFTKVVSNAFSVSLCGFVALFAVCGIIELVQPVEHMPLFLAYITASCLYSLAINLLRGLGQMKAYAAVTSVKNISQVTLNVVAVAVLMWGLYGLVLSLFITEFAAFLIVFVWKKLWRFISIKAVSRGTISEMARYSIPLIPNAICNQVINLSDRLIISLFLGVSANGVYSISYKFPSIVETVYHYFYTAWSESASRTLKDGKEAAETYYRSLRTAVSNIIYSAILFLVAFMPVLFRVFVKGDYIQGFDYVPLLMFAMYFDCMAKFYSGIYTAFKKTSVIAASTIAGALINIALNLLLINQFGLYAAAFSTLIAEAVLVVIRHRKIKLYVDMPINVRSIIVKVVGVVPVVALYRYEDPFFMILSVAIALAFGLALNKSTIGMLVGLVSGRKKKGAS